MAFASNLPPYIDDPSFQVTLFRISMAKASWHPLRTQVALTKHTPLLGTVMDKGELQPPPASTAVKKSQTLPHHSVLPFRNRPPLHLSTSMAHPLLHFLLLTASWITTSQAQRLPSGQNDPKPCTVPTDDAYYCAHVCLGAGGTQTWRNMTLSLSDWSKGWRTGRISYGHSSTACACVVRVFHPKPKSQEDGRCLARCVTAGGVWYNGRSRKPAGWRVTMYPDGDIFCPCLMLENFDGEEGRWEEGLPLLYSEPPPEAKASGVENWWYVSNLSQSMNSKPRSSESWRILQSCLWPLSIQAAIWHSWTRKKRRETIPHSSQQ
ncbi:hypothetical protein L249_4393 [Ophiocordyceps polyrhachis-furcata BCC 54312]|uniref:Uncharacterized protein n=1 Tax=Ophiocordyceps polyrhachis-furcata BCC 54312 TaxID=1330021 RepID=A0A367L7K6_9HYPO|nr:hypothetical protein L249_4393 [Ophiocordyceps polyrhachis-furcata BCC 54312]